MIGSAMTTDAYESLAAHWTRLHHLQHLAAIASWDRSALMPPKGNEARAAALAEISGLMHRKRTDPQLAAVIERAANEPLDDTQRANLREMRREYRLATALPAELVERQALVGLRCEHAWRRQRPANDWAGFVANFRDVLAIAREAAQRLADATGLSRYDALVEQYEPGMRSAELDRLFGDLRRWLPDLVAKVVARQSHETVVAPSGPFPLAQQRALSHAIVRLLGFDFEAGRLDESTHPFSGGVPEDVRMTTRYSEGDFTQALMSTIHETGHARYEQNRPRDWLGQPVSVARSFGVHESCSLSFEMQLARSRGFADLLAPLLSEHFGAQRAFEPDNLHRLLTRVKPGFIRVEADELTYPAHVIVRYEIERPLIEGAIEADDIPALWDEKMRALLDVSTRDNYTDGCLQDVHWSDGLIGYFPCYTLGALYAAQWFAAIRRRAPDLDARIARGELGVVFDWLRDNIWTAASRYEIGELARRASGEALNPAHFRAHLERRYLMPQVTPPPQA